MIPARSQGRLAIAIVAASVCICLLFQEDAHAYLDPASGSLILQVVVGVLLGALLSLKLFWARVCAFFARLFGKKPAKTEP